MVAGWPAAAVLGFLVLTGLVMALGISSTARYECDRGRALAGPHVPGAESSNDRGSEGEGPLADAGPRAAAVSAGPQAAVSATLSAAATG